MRLPALVAMHTEKVLNEVLQFAGAADGVLSRYFRQNRKIGSTERNAITEAVFAVLRNRLFFVHCVQAEEGSETRQLALLGLAEMFGSDAIGGLTEKEKQWLEKTKNIDRTLLAPEVQVGMPQWIYEKLVSRMGEKEAFSLASALNTPAPLDLRVNALKAKRDGAKAALDAQSVASASTPYAPLGLRAEKKTALQNLSLFREGIIEVQDEGSQILAHIVGARRGEMIADFCAGAGGKTLALGALMRNTGRLYAFEVSDRRLALLGPRLKRSGLSNVHTLNIAHERDARLGPFLGKMDRVLVDVPCSGLGTLRRNPDIKWRLEEGDLVAITQKQAAILASAARLVKPGGRLVYASCSVLEEENEDIIRDFLEKHPHFSLRPMREILAEQKIALEMEDFLNLLPDRHHTDGFFAAVLVRTPANEA